MHKLLCFCVCLLFACVQSKWQITHSSESSAAGNEKNGTLVFVQSTGIIESRIAQDQFVRIWKYPAVQGYVFMNKSYIDSLNLTAYKDKMREQNIAYVLLIHLQESAEPMAYTRFLEAYQSQVAKLMYNPIYAYQGTHAYVHFSVFDAQTEGLIWQAHSTKMAVSSLPSYLQNTYPKLQQALETANYFSIKKSKR